MFRRPRNVFAVRFAIVAALATWDYGSTAIAIEPPELVISASTGSLDLPPLPPRDSNPTRVAPAREGDSGRAEIEIVDVIVATSPAAQPATVAALGWEDANGEITGRSRLQEAGFSSSSPAGAAEQAAAAWTLVEASPESAIPLIDTGVFRSEALFEGVPVLNGELAPLPIGLGDESVAAEMAAILALAPEPLTLPPRIANAAELAPAPIDVVTPAIVPNAPSEPMTQEQALIAAATAELHKPVAAIHLTGALGKREPPDQASAALPAGMPQMIWGQPWPDMRLACYRYSVPFVHRPLYFEQPNFERCGESWWFISPYASATHFFTSALTLPLHLVIDPPCRCVPTLGDCPYCHERYGLCPTLNRSR